MDIADSNLKDSGPRRRASENGAARTAGQSAIGKRAVAGIGLLVLAVVLWSLRDTRLTVRAPTSDEAIELASRMSLAMASAFAKEGPATLSVDIRRRTTPVEDSTTTAAGYAMRLGAAVVGLLGALLIALGWFGLQAGPDRLPQQFWWLAAVGSALAAAPVFLPGDVIMALFFMAIPVSLAGVILWKGIQVHHAAAWPSTRGRIVKSTLR